MMVHARRSPCPVGAEVTLRRACLGCGGFPAASQRRYARGQVLAHQDEPAEHVYALVAGWLREVVYGADGRVLWSRLASPGRVLGPVALARWATGSHAPRHTATIEAVAPARVCVLRSADVQSWLCDDAERALEVTAAAMRALDDARRDGARRGLPAVERVLALLREIAAIEADAAGWLALPCTRAQLGEALGLTAETVSRALGQLRRGGLIAARGRRIAVMAG